MTIHVIHENRAWLPPFADALEAEGLPWEEWYLDGGVLDLDAPPPDGVFCSRMSASSRARGDPVHGSLTTVSDRHRTRGRRKRRR